MGRKKKIKEPVSTAVSESVGSPIDLAEYSAPAPVEPAPIVDASKIMDGEPMNINTGEPEKKEKRKYTKRQKDDDMEMPFIDGEMLLLFIDLIIPAIITLTNNWVTNEKMSPDDLMLTEKQKTQMKKLADKVAEKIDLNMHPLLGLTIGIGGIYTMNFLAAKNKK